MESVLNDHVKQLVSGRRVLDHMDRFWDVFSMLVRTELRRRGLSTAPTRYLGVAGAGTWSERNAFDELCHECYRFAVLDRLAGLTRYTQQSICVDTAIRRNIANCFTELQRKNDPVGYAAFRNAEGAIDILLQREELTGTSLLGRRVRNRTVLRFTGISPSMLPVGREVLVQQIGAYPGWERIVPYLGRCSIKTQAFVANVLAALGQANVPAFRFSDLASLVKQQARDYWAQQQIGSKHEAGIDPTNGELSNIVPVAPQVSAFEEQEAMDRLVVCLKGHIARVRQIRARERLEMLLRELLDDALQYSESPSLGECARRLDLPTSTLHDTVKMLRAFATKCRQV